MLYYLFLSQYHLSLGYEVTRSLEKAKRKEMQHDSRGKWQESKKQAGNALNVAVVIAPVHASGDVDGARALADEAFEVLKQRYHVQGKTFCTYWLNCLIYAVLTMLLPCPSTNLIWRIGPGFWAKSLKVLRRTRQIFIRSDQPHSSNQMRSIIGSVVSSPSQHLGCFRTTMDATRLDLLLSEELLCTSWTLPSN